MLSALANPQMRRQSQNPASSRAYGYAQLQANSKHTTS